MTSIQHIMHYILGVLFGMLFGICIQHSVDFYSPMSTFLENHIVWMVRVVTGISVIIPIWVYYIVKVKR